MQTSPPGFTLNDVTVRRGTSALLDSVTCRIPTGACTAVIGPSGAGKSTLLRLLNRLEEPTKGTVSLSGRPLPTWDVLALRRQVTLVGQQPVLLGDTVLADLQVGRPELTGRLAADLLERVQLPAGYLKRPTAGLSGGEAQRLCLARALAVNPQILLLDEPTSALDAANTTAVESAVRTLVTQGLTVVLVSHDTVQVRRICEQVLVLNGGRLVERGHAQHVAYLTEEPR